MATLQGQTIAGSYKDLLQVSNSNDGVDATARAVEDGEGTATLLYLSTTEVYNPGTGGTSNTAFGKNAGDALASGGNYNVVIGEEAGTAITTGDENVALGYAALDANQTGGSNVAVGASAAGAFIGSYSVAIGREALRDANHASTADGSVAIGQGALAAMTSSPSNTAVGYQSGAATTGGYNTYFGYQAGKGASGAEQYNTGVGQLALGALTDGSHNVAIGRVAGDALTTGSSNIIIGSGAGSETVDVDRAVIIGQDAGGAVLTSAADGTIAIGFQSLLANTTGQYNTSVGYNSLVSNVAGDKNVALGYQAGEDYNPTADYGNAVFIGHQAGLNVTLSRKSTVIGYAAVGLGIMTGHENTAIGNEAGYDMTSCTHNLVVGNESGANLTSGSSNVALGSQSLINDLLGTGSTAVGYAALNKQVNATSGDSYLTHNTGLGGYAGYYNVTGINNTYLGYEAAFGALNQSNSGNTAVGTDALHSVTTGSDNVVIGYNAGFANTLGGQNVYIGKDAAEGSTQGDYNTVVGHAAFKAANGNDSNNNTVIGFEAGKALTDGHSNTMVGSKAGDSVQGGDGNAMLGFEAGEDLTSGSNCIFIGRDSNPATGSHNKQIAIGYLVETSAAEQLRIGDSTNYLTYDYSGGGAGVAITSDERTKKDIVDTDLGLEFIKELRPIKYRMKATIDWPRNFVSKKISDAELNKEPKDTVWDGFLAQEVKAAADKLGINYSGWTEDAGMGGRQELDYAKFVVPLVKAVQELSAKVKALEDA